jgi:aspartate/tyrosine/aromatic aminotransferase
MVFFDKVPLVPADPILGLSVAFREDPRPSKVNLGAGVYKNEQLVTPVMRAVKQAESRLLQGEESKEYLPIDGEPLYIEQVGRLVWGPDWEEVAERTCGFQAPGGTGALRVGGTFLNKQIGANLFIPQPSWPNHKGVFTAAGFEVGVYPYYNFSTHTVEFEHLFSFLSKLAPGNIILFHASCHNPTGEDFSREQWEILSEVCLQRRLLPFFDCAYQGFGQGLDRDVESIRLFAKKGLEMIVAVSQSKNFSLYGERVGGLYVLSKDKEMAGRIRSLVKQVIRTLYSNPPMHGAKVVGEILRSPHLRAIWLEELGEMRMRITAMRGALVDALSKRVRGKDLSYMQRGNGMFCFTGLNKSQVERMLRDEGIYMTADGRINICGVNAQNIDYVVNGFARAMEGEE